MVLMCQVCNSEIALSFVIDLKDILIRLKAEVNTLKNSNF